MKITVINGTEKHGITYRLKEIFLEPFRGTSQITEFYLPKDGPSYCSGCVSCVLKGAETCKDVACVRDIADALLEADLVVMTSPAYVKHVTGAMKSLLDHFAYFWMPHRPAPEMFQKRAVIITQCLGAGDASAARDIRDSLSWWGISDISAFRGKLMTSMRWDELPEKKRMRFQKRLQRMAERILASASRAPRVRLDVRAKFSMVRLLQKDLHAKDPEHLDGKYWAEHGWLDAARPWRH